MKYICKIIIIYLLFSFSYKVCAYCSLETKVKYGAYVNNINYVYDYYIDNDIAYFNVLLSNIPNNVNMNDDKGNMYNNIFDTEVTLGPYTDNVKFTFYSNECESDIGYLNINFPIYNKFYNKDICNKYINQKWCKKWVDKLYTMDEIEEFNKDYEEKKLIENNKNYIKNDMFDKLNSFYVKYYYIFLPIIIVLGVVLIIRINKKQKFELYN